MALTDANQPRAAREILLDMDPERALGWRLSPKEVWPRYRSRLAMTWHMTGDYRSELAITDRWRDSAAGEWLEVRRRALAALGREREVREVAIRCEGDARARLPVPADRAEQSSLGELVDSAVDAAEPAGAVGQCRECTQRDGGVPSRQSDIGPGMALTGAMPGRRTGAA